MLMLYCTISIMEGSRKNCTYDMQVPVCPRPTAFERAAGDMKREEEREPRNCAGANRTTSEPAAEHLEALNSSSARVSAR